MYPDAPNTAFHDRSIDDAETPTATTPVGEVNVVTADTWIDGAEDPDESTAKTT